MKNSKVVAGQNFKSAEPIDFKNKDGKDVNANVEGVVISVRMKDVTIETLDGEVKVLKKTFLESNCAIEGETPSQETPADETPVDETPAETVEDETPIEEDAPSDETPKEEAPVEKKKVGKSKLDDIELPEGFDMTTTRQEQCRQLMVLGHTSPSQIGRALGCNLSYTQRLISKLREVGLEEPKPAEPKAPKVDKKVDETVDETVVDPAVIDEAVDMPTEESTDDEAEQVAQ